MTNIRRIPPPLPKQYTIPGINLTDEELSAIDVFSPFKIENKLLKYFKVFLIYLYRTMVVLSLFVFFIILTLGLQGIASALEDVSKYLSIGYFASTMMKLLSTKNTGSGTTTLGQSYANTENCVGDTKPCPGLQKFPI